MYWWGAGVALAEMIGANDPVNTSLSFDPVNTSLSFGGLLTLTWLQPPSYAL